RALPEDERPELAQLLGPFDDRREVVSCQHAGFAREMSRAVGEEDLGLADAAGVEEQFAGVRVAGRVLGPDPDVQLTERNPAGLAAPTCVEHLALERQQPPKSCNRLRRRALLEPCLE